jgi:hypothetical protein
MNFRAREMRQATRGWSRSRGADEEVRPVALALGPLEREITEGEKSGELGRF